jgi:glycosyltransferase involved in cell wall biosynthesis
MIKLSILILTVPSRLNTFYPKLMNELIKQTKDREDVEILALFDNKKRTIGQARNDLLNLAQGQYLTFIDDDDTISSDYIDSALDAINKNMGIDRILFNIDYTINEKKLHNYESCIKQLWRTDIAKFVQFPKTNYAEDSDWAKEIKKYAKTEIKVNKTLYYYIYKTETSESQWFEKWQALEKK